MQSTDGRRRMRQVNPLTARLRDILRNYSSAQVLNEMLQNADDAGSKEFKVLIDSRSFGTASLLSPKLAHTQGPALYQFDDAEFNPDDYESIQRVGDGTKMGDPTKTGQFGLGFNSVYHLTDTPMFISGADFVVFDPHESHLPDGLPGLCESAAALAASCPDQTAPFTGVFGCDPAAGWRTPSGKGTLFRLPLRTREAASTSKIKDGKVPDFDPTTLSPVSPLAPLNSSTNHCVVGRRADLRRASGDRRRALPLRPRHGRRHVQGAHPATPPALPSIRRAH